MQDYLETFKTKIDCTSLQKLRNDAIKSLNAEGIKESREAYEKIKKYHFEACDFSKDEVVLGNNSSINDDEKLTLKNQLLTLAPWRKGPFQIAGIELDAEWRSDFKWNRVLPALEPLTNRRVCDIGANSGYYMYRMLAQNPEMVLGLDPTLRYYYQFLALQKLAPINQLHYEPFGLEELKHFPSFFDTIFCMGILYHHRAPIDILRMINEAMTNGGQLIVESQGIPGEGPYALCPDKTYAKIKGTYFVPTAECLVNWLKKAYFENINIFCVSNMSSEEQRPTEWMTKESFKDFVDEKKHLTIEGYPAPIRIYVSANKKGLWKKT